MTSANTKFVFRCSDAVKAMLLREGLDRRYGARHLKRSIERFLVLPISNLVATGQVEFGDSICLDLDQDGREISFSKYPGGTLIDESQIADEKEEFVALLGAAARKQQSWLPSEQAGQSQVLGR